MQNARKAVINFDKAYHVLIKAIADNNKQTAATALAEWEFFRLQLAETIDLAMKRGRLKSKATIDKLVKAATDSLTADWALLTCKYPEYIDARAQAVSECAGSVAKVIDRLVTSTQSKLNLASFGIDPTFSVKQFLIAPPATTAPGANNAPHA